MQDAVRDLERINRSIRYFERTGTQRIAEDVADEVLGEVEQLARRRGFGFIDRTGRLRRSLRIEQSRDVRGRFTFGKALVAKTPYAAYVERRKRTRDKRRGPPYWLGEAVRRVLARANQKVKQAGERSLAREVRKARRR